MPRKAQDPAAPSLVRDRPTWLLSRNYARSKGLLNDGFAGSGTGLRSYHYRLLAALEEWGPASQAELGRRTSVDRSDVVAVLGELEGRGLVARSVDPAHRRRNIVSLTTAGGEMLRTLDRVVDEIQETLLAPLSPAERGQLTTLLRKLADTG